MFTWKMAVKMERKSLISRVGPSRRDLYGPVFQLPL